MSREKLISEIQKKYGKGSIQSETVVSDVKVVSTGSLTLDIALGIGGFPYGRIVEIYGPESSGKTTLALTALANSQSQGKLAGIIDMEHAVDPQYAQALGVDLNKWLFSQPESAEQALSILEVMLKSGEVGLIVVDSVAALVPSAELDGEVGESKMGLQARLMSQAMRKINPILGETCVIFINQLRDKIGVLFGSPETTTGGNALKFYASVRIDIRKSGTSVKDKDGNKTANPVKMKVVKNKLAPPFTEAESTIYFGKGFSKETDLIELGVECGILEKNGAWYGFDGENLAQGKDAMVIFLKDNVEFAQVIENKIKEYYNV